MNIFEIRKKSLFEEIDYLQLMQILKNYAEPRKKIQSFLKARDLIRVKKGLYVFGEKVAQEPYCKEHLANLVYGPSAISFEYALSFYGLIPERVEEITCITIRRNKSFITPIGRFSYRYLALKRYPYGIRQIPLRGRNVLLASKEKSLCDMLTLKVKPLKNIHDLEEYLIANLRIDEHSIQNLDLLLTENLSNTYNDKNVHLLATYLRKIQK